MILELNTTLLREKFTIRDMERDGESPLVAVSNRLVLSLSDEKDSESEVFVIRSQTMYGAVRTAAYLLKDFLTLGPLLSRPEPYPFATAWDNAVSDHEFRYNLNRWACVYHKGKELFAAGPHHPFLDVIEKCDAKNPGNYDKALKIAEDIFGKAGRKVGITYESNIGMVVHLRPETGRCGLVYRGPIKNSTFNFVVDPLEEKDIPFHGCLNICAAFLEGLQLSFKIGRTNARLQRLQIEKFSPEAKESHSAVDRLNDLSTEIRSFTNWNKVRFRPEKPEFAQMINDAESSYKG